ncbi:MAG: hypothetical protein HOE90_12835 [Bacteriovoracaceae bacterium]|jgi:hypothetical protein|nr:hypothetical protein [Bacteriovoracaceae bacterium]
MKTSIILAAIFSWISINCYASVEHPFRYKQVKGRFKINPYEYRKYVRPQLLNILREFNQFLSLIDPHFKHILTLKTKIVDTNRNIGLWNKSCLNEFSDDCLEKLKFIHLELGRLEKSILTGQRKYSLATNSGNSHSLEQMTRNLSLVKSLDQLGNLVYLANHQVELIMSEYISYHVPNVDSNLQLQQTMGKVLIQWEIMLVDFTPDHLREGVQGVYSNFFREISRIILTKNDLKYFGAQLENLNFSWNNFHRTIAKEKYLTPNKLTGVIGTIHTRWNMILKVLLKRIR